MLKDKPILEPRKTNEEIGKKIIDITALVDLFEEQEGEIHQIIGKTGNGKTYEGTRRALDFLQRGHSVYTTWDLILPEYYDQRESLAWLIGNLFMFKKTFFRINFQKNWHKIDIDRPDLVEFVAGLTDCIVLLDEGQDIFDSYEGRGMSQNKRKTLTRTRHLHKTLIIISQRAQAVAVTARANVTYFYKCVKTRAFWFPFLPYFKVYRTEEMDDQNFPVWEARLPNGKTWYAPLWHSHFASQKIYDAYNSWYLRAGVIRSQIVHFEAFQLNTWNKVVGIVRLLFKMKKKVKKPLIKPVPQTKKTTPRAIDGIKQPRYEM